jgi:hypothetical protein
MEANVFIKSIKTEGNKITDIQFDGDWEIDLAGTGTVTGGQTVPYNNPQGDVECWKEFEASQYAEFRAPGGVILLLFQSVSNATSNPEYNHLMFSKVYTSMTSVGSTGYSRGSCLIGVDKRTLILVYDNLGNYKDGIYLEKGSRSITEVHA